MHQWPTRGLIAVHGIGDQTPHETLRIWSTSASALDLAIVWIEYVSRRRHLDYLREVWGIGREAPPAEVGRAAQAARLWWLRR